MPELPDVTLYVERLEAFVVGRVLEGVRLASPSLVKTFDPPVSALHGKRVSSVHRIGKRIVFAFPDEVFAVVHLMIAGRFRWRKRLAKLTRRRTHAAFDFEHGVLVLTEASTRKRASLHVVRGVDAVSAFDRGGLDLYAATAGEFAARMRDERHTLKRALTDPRLVDGVGNAYSDEILHRARLSPMQLTTNLSEEEMLRLLTSARDVLTEWTDRHREKLGDKFPDKVTAFHPEMAVHGKYREPCPACEAPVQRVVYAEREFNYCAGCQTGGRLLKDRALSRLLHADWPDTLDEL